MIFLLHVTLSISSPTLSTVLFMSRWHASFQLVITRPLVFFPGISVLNTLLRMCSSSLFITCPYQFNHLFVTFLVVPRMCAFLILPLRVTLHINCSIIISFNSIIIFIFLLTKYNYSDVQLHHYPLCLPISHEIPWARHSFFFFFLLSNQGSPHRILHILQANTSSSLAPTSCMSSSSSSLLMSTSLWFTNYLW